MYSPFSRNRLSTEEKIAYVGSVLSFVFFLIGVILLSMGLSKKTEEEYSASKNPKLFQYTEKEKKEHLAQIISGGCLLGLSIVLYFLTMSWFSKKIIMNNKKY
jgi:Na+-transporting methylmalonyl-CoA/oxaloacetate decarboxylase gamma subunit